MAKECVYSCPVLVECAGALKKQKGLRPWFGIGDSMVNMYQAALYESYDCNGPQLKEVTIKSFGPWRKIPVEVKVERLFCGLHSEE